MEKRAENEIITPEEFLQKYADGEDIPLSNEVDSSEAGLNRTRQILSLSDKLLDKINMAIDEVDLYKIKVKEKTKDVEYDDETKKVVSETQTEKEMAQTGKSLIDTSALKQLVSTLKDIKDIHVGLSNAKASEDDGESGVIVISDVENGEE